jgi:hypothetical protein
VITTNTAWNAKNALMAKRPIYALSIAGVSTVFTSRDLAAEGVTGSLPTYKPWLNTPAGASQTIDVVNGTSSIGEMQCEVVDHGGFVRGLVGGNSGLVGAAVTLSVGYPGIAWTEFVALATYVLYKVNPTPGFTSWMFVSRDRQVLAKKTVYYHPENGELLSKDNPWYLAGTPCECFLAIVLFALGLDASTVDLVGLEALDSPAEGLFSGVRPFLFVLTESFEAKQFIESEILKPAGMYAVVTNTGQISLRAGRAPAAGPSPVFGFTADNVVVLPTVDRMPIINEAAWQYDDQDGTAESYVTYLEAASITTFGRGNQFSVQSKGLRTELGAAWFTQWTSSRLFRRFAGTPAGLLGGAPVVDVEAMLLTMPVWVGDYVTLSHPKMPDVMTGALGVVNRVYEVIDRSPDYVRGRMKYKLLDTGLTGAGAAPVYGTAVIGTAVIF